MHWLVALLGVLTAWVILRYSPFPRTPRLGLPFVFGFVYQTAVTARSYCLVPLLVFTLCILLTGHKKRPIAFAIVAGLLANCALVAAVMSAGFVTLFLWREFLSLGRDRANSPVGSAGAARLQTASAGVILLAFWASAILVALPAPGLAAGSASVITAHPQLNRVLIRLTGIQPPNAPIPSQAGTQTPTVTVIAPWQEPDGVSPWQHWILERIDGLSHPSIGWLLLKRLVASLSVFFFCISSFNILAAAFYLFFFVWMYRHRFLVASLPFVLTLIACYVLAFSDHHASLPLTALVGTLWLIWDSADVPLGSAFVDKAFAVLLLAVLVEQICWTGSAVRLGMLEPFDGSLEAVHFIKSEVGTKKIACVGFFPVAVEPYFDGQVFSNFTKAFWHYDLPANPLNHVMETIDQRPPYIIDGEIARGTESPTNQLLLRQPIGFSWQSLPIYETLVNHGYHETHRFCGKQPAHFGYAVQVCQIIFQPDHSAH